MFDFEKELADWQKKSKRLTGGNEEVFLVSSKSLRCWQVWTGNDNQVWKYGPRWDPAWESAFHAMHGQRVTEYVKEEWEGIYQAAKQYAWREFTLNGLSKVHAPVFALHERSTHTKTTQYFEAVHLLFPLRTSP
jgi:hypothetical protein